MDKLPSPQLPEIPTKYKFSGLMTPVFACFKDDEECSLNLQPIDEYARWLKANEISGVLVNGISGEGPALGHNERRLNALTWVQAARKHNLTIFLQVGGGSLPDVEDLTAQALELKVDGIFCLPELFYKPSNADQLTSYCSYVAAKCNLIPFFYVHSPIFTGVYEFITKAVNVIPNFAGIQYNDINLDTAANCLNRGSIVFMTHIKSFASALLMGFDAFLMSIFSIRPDLCMIIYKAAQENDLLTVKRKQRQLNNLIDFHVGRRPFLEIVPALKEWFNNSMARIGGGGFTAGPPRKFL